MCWMSAWIRLPSSLKMSTACISPPFLPSVLLFHLIYQKQQPHRLTFCKWAIGLIVWQNLTVKTHNNHMYPSVNGGGPFSTIYCKMDIILLGEKRKPLHNLHSNIPFMCSDWQNTAEFLHWLTSFLRRSQTTLGWFPDTGAVAEI